MNVAVHRPMSQLEFLDWAALQDASYEFDGFQPVAMTGGDLGHSRLIRNINRQLANRLAGKACEPLGPDAGVATVGQIVRSPDAVVTCSAFNEKDRLVPQPIIVFEVVSPTSVRTDRVIKLREYQAVPSIRRYVLVETVALAVTVGSEMFVVAGLAEDDVLVLPEIDVEIPVAMIYEGVAFDECKAGATPPGSA